MSNDIQNILTLADTLGAHLGVTHWAISMRVSTKGDFIKKLRDGGDARTKTVSRVFELFSQQWPADLDWPNHVPRPNPTQQEKRA
jgi:hypothetical protein